MDHEKHLFHGQNIPAVISWFSLEKQKDPTFLPQSDAYVNHILKLVSGEGYHVRIAFLIG